MKMNPDQIQTRHPRVCALASTLPFLPRAFEDLGLCLQICLFSGTSLGFLFVNVHLTSKQFFSPCVSFHSFLSGLILCFCLQLLEQGNKLVLEQVVTTLASVADTAEEKFVNYYDRFVF